jgi:hypothetical protein
MTKFCVGPKIMKLAFSIAAGARHHLNVRQDFAAEPSCSALASTDQLLLRGLRTLERGLVGE